MRISHLALGSILLAAALSWWLLRADRGDAPRGGHTLTFHCAAGIKRPVTEIAKAYEKETGNRVELTFGGSGTLLSALAIRAHGDLYLAGDDSYIEDARKRGLVAERIPVATMRPVIAVATGNPKSVQHLEDLLRDDVRAGLGSPKAAAIGRVARQAARERALWSRLERKVAVFKPTVSDLANDLKIGTIDTAILWDATVRQYPELEIVEDQDLFGHTRAVTLGVLTASPQPQAALHFARYLSARDRGLPVFARHGFVTARGDAWADVPTLRLMSGAMLRPAIDATIKAFEAREGVRIDVVYDGCGILVSQMKTGSIPDAYFSCDFDFFMQVRESFEAATTISTNEIVMLVAKGNPLAIHSLDDLLAKARRVGLGHPQKSALGRLTADLLIRSGHLARLRNSGHVAVESATGDLLVNQLLAGSLDAAIVYRSNTAHVRDRSTVVEIQEITSRATQPFAVATETKYPRLLERLLRALRTDASRRRFEDLGFQWRAGGAPK